MKMSRLTDASPSLVVDSMQKILVLPRERFNGLDGLVEWPRAGELIESAAENVSWMARIEAESSQEWVQPIPCAILRDSNGRYCVFRQARQLRRDLSNRVSFIVGGHIDSDWDIRNVSALFEKTVKREVSEEIGVDLASPPKPVGAVIDSSSMIASRHIGFIYEAVLDQQIKSLVADEFSVGSKYNGKFFSIESLSRFRSEFDPWSFILFSQYLGGGFSMDIGRQPTLSIPTE